MVSSRVGDQGGRGHLQVEGLGTQEPILVPPLTHHLPCLPYTHFTLSTLAQMMSSEISGLGGPRELALALVALSTFGEGSGGAGASQSLSSFWSALSLTLQH